MLGHWLAQTIILAFAGSTMCVTPSQAPSHQPGGYAVFKARCDSSDPSTSADEIEGTQQRRPDQHHHPCQMTVADGVSVRVNPFVSDTNEPIVGNAQPRGSEVGGARVDSRRECRIGPAGSPGIMADVRITPEPFDRLVFEPQTLQAWLPRWYSPCAAGDVITVYRCPPPDPTTRLHVSSETHRHTRRSTSRGQRRS